MELDVIAQGARGARRTLEWIDRSTEWTFEGEAFPIGQWPDQVRTLASAVLTGDEREKRQTDCAHGLVGRLLDDDELADQITYSDFATMTEATPSLRSAIVEALFMSARRPSSQAPPVIGFPLFAESALGWDVVAAACSNVS